MDLTGKATSSAAEDGLFHLLRPYDTTHGESEALAPKKGKGPVHRHGLIYLIEILQEHCEISVYLTLIYQNTYLRVRNISQGVAGWLSRLSV